MSKNKWHKDCGGKVVYQKPIEKGVGFEQAGECQKCLEYPLLEEEIIFEIDKDHVERFYGEKATQGWKIVNKGILKEKLEDK